MMNNICVWYIGNRWIVVQQCIQYSIVRVVCVRMYNQIVWFIDYDDVIIFVNDIEWNILWLEVCFFFDFYIDSDVFFFQYFFFWFIVNGVID